MRICLLGMGLIGGSMVRALRVRGAFPAADGFAATPLEIAAWTPTGRGPAQARAAGFIDFAASDPRAAVRGAALVVLAAPPLACLDLLDLLGGPARTELDDDVVVTDVASTKAEICDRAARLDLPFVGSHPMAGTEASGFGAADATLFDGRPWVIVPGPTSPVGGPELVSSLARACGGQPVEMDASQHDAAVAAISHLPLILSAALVAAVAGPPRQERPGWPTARRLAAGGWTSMTRLARGDAEMAAGIVATNAGPLLGRLQAMARELDEWIALLETSSPDAGAIRARFAEARDRLHEPGGDVESG